VALSDFPQELIDSSFNALLPKERQLRTCAASAAPRTPHKPTQLEKYEEDSIRYQ
jgi:hypothetical protein